MFVSDLCFSDNEMVEDALSASQPRETTVELKDAEFGNENPNTAVSGSQIEDIIDASQQDVQIELISDRSPEEWFLKYKHQKGQLRFCGKKYVALERKLERVQEDHKNVVEENILLRKVNENLTKSLKMLSSDLQKAVGRTNKCLMSVTK